MTAADAEQLLRNRGALLRGHFVLSSGRHSDTYVEKFRILQWPDVTSALCRGIAERFAGAADTVAGPTTGGIIVAFETARQLGARCVIAERAESGSGREFRRGFELGPGHRVLVVDDVLTTGGSVREVMEAVERTGAAVVGVAVLVDRTAGRTNFEYPFYAVLSLDIRSWEPSECPLCREGVPATVT